MVFICEPTAANCGSMDSLVASWKYSNHRMRFVKIRSFLYRTINGFLCILILNGCGEKFTSEGNALGKAINEHLIAQTLCKDHADCKKKVEIYGGHGNQVNFSAYAVKDPRLVYAVMGFVASEGMRITKGVPISVSFYPEPHEHYVNTINFSKPTINLEIMK